MKLRNILGRFFLPCLFCVFFFSAALVTDGHAAVLNDRIRVGIYYGNNALPAASLANEVGSGYRFGFYDSQYTFIPLGQTEKEKISVCKDKNLYLSGNAFYESKPESYTRLIGAYHVQMPGTYASFSEAAEAAKAYPYGFPAYVNGAYVVRYEFFSSEANAMEEAEALQGASVVGASTTCYTVVNTETGDILYEQDLGTAGCLAIAPDLTGASEPSTWFKGYCYYGNFQYNRRNGNDITVINIVPTDTYVGCVLPCEFVCSGGAESLKAGAVAIRTFASATVKHQSLGFDICTSTDCQVYHGVYNGSTAAAAMSAAKATSGKKLYYDGKLIQALFYAANGGKTEAAENTWGYPYPYLIAQEDPYENAIQFPSQSWSYTVTPEQVQKCMQNCGYSCGKVVSMQITQYTPIGNVNQVTITDETGKVITLTKDNVRLLQNISGVSYFGRGFSITPITEQGEATVTAQNIQQEKISVKDKASVSEPDEIYALASNGTILITGSVPILTQNGVVTVQKNATSQMPAEAPSKVIGWTLAGRGFGHNVGLSQWGAYAMAAQGFTYDQILSFYYPGTTIG